MMLVSGARGSACPGGCADDPGIAPPGGRNRGRLAALAESRLGAAERRMVAEPPGHTRRKGGRGSLSNCYTAFCTIPFS